MGQNSGLLSSLTDWNSTLAGYADSISSGVVMPIALTVLALFMVLELYNFTQTIAMNGGSTAFTIQQVALVMLKITLCRWAVLHSTEILNAMFELAATVTNGIAGYVGSGQVNTEVDIENAISALPGGIGNMPVAMELNLTTKDFISPSSYNWHPEHDETVVLLSHKKPDSYIHIDVEFGEGEGKIPVDKIVQRAEQYKPKERVTYKRIKEYILEKYGFKVHTAYIAEVKRSLGLPMYDAPNAVEKLKQARKHPTPEKVEAIKDALHYFAVI